MVNDGIIIAAGKGSRMKKNDSSLIKPLVKINGKELIRYAIDAIIANNINNIYVVQNLYENLEILQEYYPNNKLTFLKSDNKYSAVICLNNVLKLINGSFILSDCDLVGNTNDIANMLDYAIKNITKCDGFVTMGINPKMGNNHYLTLKNNRIISFDKSGVLSNMHGGFMYVFNEKFKPYLKDNITYQDMAYILDGYFKNYNVWPMMINDINDIDEEKEIEIAQRVMKLTK